MSDENFLGGIGAYLFDPKATKYTRPELEPFPAREDVIAARDYKERFGNPNEMMIRGTRVIEPPHGNVRSKEEGTPLRQVSKGQAAEAWNEYRRSENRDKEILSKVNKAPLDEAAADALYAEQIAANRSSIGMMAFDPDRMAISPSNRGRTTIGLAGMYMGGREDMAWQDQDDPGGMVHEMFHRGLKPLMAKDRNKYNEEIMVRALIQRHHGDIEEKSFRPENRDEKTQPGWAEIQRAKRAMNDPEFVKELDKYERMAGEVIAARNLERHPIGLGYATGGQVSNTKAIAKHLATMGRYGDDHLLHVNSAELRGLAAAMPGGKLTINPQTGQPEAFLPFLLPLLGGLAGSAFLPGAVTAMGLGTLGTTMAGAIGSGAVAAGLGLAQGDKIENALGKGALAGLGSYGFGSAMEGLASGTGATATEVAEQAAKEAAKQGTQGGIGAAIPTGTPLDPSVMPSTSGIDKFNPLDQGQYLPASSAQPWAGQEGYAASAQPWAGAGVPSSGVSGPLNVPSDGWPNNAISFGERLSNAGSNYLDTAQKAGGNLLSPKALWGTFGENAGRTTIPLGLSIAGQGMFDERKSTPQMPVEQTYPPASTLGTGREYTPAPASYRPGRDPEWSYFQQGPRYQDGGRVKKPHPLFDSRGPDGGHSWSMYSIADIADDKVKGYGHLREDAHEWLADNNLSERARAPRTEAGVWTERMRDWNEQDMAADKFPMFAGGGEVAPRAYRDGNNVRPSDAYFNDLTVGTYPPLNAKNLIKSGAMRVTQPGNGRDGGFDESDDPEMWSLVSHANDTHPDSQTRAWPDKPSSYESASRMLNEPGMSAGKYRQLVWSAQQRGMPARDMYLPSEYQQADTNYAGGGGVDDPEGLMAQGYGIGDIIPNRSPVLERRVDADYLQPATGEDEVTRLYSTPFRQRRNMKMPDRDNARSINYRAFTDPDAPLHRYDYALGGPISGPGGGLDDSIPAIIDGRVPASLSSGEHVIPAAVVSALGNGSTEEGSRQLEAMTDRILKKKFGTKNRTPRPLNPAKMMPV